jgi:radical SAM protein with 4Fe4S-binding SPASM domain
LDYQLEELSIEVTGKCDMRCIHCSSGSTSESDKGLSIPIMMDLMKQARTLGATVVSFSGGDPFVLPDIGTSLVEEAYEIGFEDILYYTTGIRSIMYLPIGSNSCLTEPDSWRGGIASDFSIHGFDRFKDRLIVIFSLHSHIPTVNDYIMGIPGAFFHIYYNIQNLVDSGYKVNVHMVPMLPNWDHAIGLRNLCANLGVSKMSMLRFVPQTRGRLNNRKLALNVEEFYHMQCMMDEMLREPDPSMPSDPHPVELRLGCPIDFRHTICDDIDSKVHPCHAGTDLMLVRPNGDVHPCAAWKTLPNNENIYGSSLKDIWERGQIFTALRHFREEGYKDLIGTACTICRYLDSCKSGCLAQRLHATYMLTGHDACIGDLYWHNSDPLCPIDYA